MCQKHLDKHKMWARDRKEKGLCRNCDFKVEPGKTLCKDHLQKMIDRHAKKKEEKIAKGICIRCGDPAKEGYGRCEKHLAYARKWASMKNRPTDLYNEAPSE